MNNQKGRVVKKWSLDEETYLMDTIRDNPNNLNKIEQIQEQIALKLDRTLSSVRQRYVIIINRNNPKKKKPEKRAYNKRAIEERNTLPAISSQPYTKTKYPVPMNDVETLRMETAKGLITKLDGKEKQQLLNYLLNL